MATNLPNLTTSMVLALGVFLCALGVARSDSCEECKAECDHGEKAMECLAEANEAPGSAACGALMATCRTHCTCPDPEKVSTCIAGAKATHESSAGTCRIQYPDNPTGCMDQNNQNLNNAIALCKVEP